MPLHPAVAFLAAIALSLPSIAAPASQSTEASRPQRAEWIEGAVVYGVVPPLFGDSGFRSVTERLDALSAQGVDVLWLSPIFETDDLSHISYAPTSDRAVRADFGGPEALRVLVREAKKRGMRVILDFVANHTSWKHPHFLHAEEHGKASEHWSRYQRNPDGTVRHEFHWRWLKNLDVTQPIVRRDLTDALLYWVREFDVDGFRLDAAWGPRDRDPSFWPEVVAALRAERSDLFLLAEAGACESYWMEHGFDAAYDWTPKLGEWSWAGVFEEPAKAGARLRAALERCDATPANQVARFLDNNDTDQRFVTRHGPALTRAATVVLHTLPGVPLLFTGSEVGAEYHPYADGPPLSWDDPHDLKPLHVKLAELRETVPALRRGAFEILRTDVDSAFAFRRTDGESVAVVITDFSGAKQVDVELPAALAGNAFRDALTGEQIQPKRSGSGKWSVGMGVNRARVLLPERP